MKDNRLKALAAVAIFEAFVIAGLLVSDVGVRFIRMRLTPPTPIVVDTGPLFTAVEFDSSDEKFEELVKLHRGWIPYRPTRGGQPGRSVLSTCALLMRTNYVRILIANGADVQEAVEWHRNHGSDEAAQLLKQIEAEVKPKND